MKFEELEFAKQIAFLRRLHAELNNILFDGTLREDLIIDICNINKRFEDDEALASFMMQGAEVLLSPTGTGILFDPVFVEDTSRICDDEGEYEQLSFICRTMLHEMIHQYIYETGRTEDGTHMDIFMEESLKHGLGYYFEGVPGTQYVKDDVIDKLVETGIISIQNSYGCLLVAFLP